MGNLRVPLVPHIGIRRRTADGEAYNEHIGLRIRQGAQAVIFLLTSSVPQVKANRSAIHRHLSTVIVKYCGDILFWKGIGGVTDKKACFSNGAITNDYTLYCLHSS